MTVGVLVRVHHELNSTRDTLLVVSRQSGKDCVEDSLEFIFVHVHESFDHTLLNIIIVRVHSWCCVTSLIYNCVNNLFNEV